MDPRLLRYYNQELQHLREMGAEFAQQFPKIAARLRMDGIEVLRRVKKTQPAIEVIILTGHGSEVDKKVCMELGAFAYLQKPVDIDELSGTIKAAHDQIRRTRDDMKPIQADR